jgi:DNA-binding transcriptional MerR regulator
MEMEPELKKYQKLVFENLDKCQDIDLLIIKGQIIIEHHLNRFIVASVKNPKEYNDTKFSFAQKIQLSKMLGLSIEVIEELTIINKLRNQIAHRLAYNENQLDILISRIANYYPSLIKNKSKFIALKSGLVFLCGALYEAVAINRPDFLKILDNELEQSLEEKDNSIQEMEN